MSTTLTASRIIVDSDQGLVHTEHVLARAAQVQMVIEPDGTVSDPTCASVSCDGECALKSRRVQGSRTECWCNCN